MFGIGIKSIGDGRYLEIENDEIEKPLPRKPYASSRLRATRDLAGTWHPLENLLQFVNEVVVILNDENVQRHRAHRSSNRVPPSLAGCRVQTPFSVSIA